MTWFQENKILALLILSALWLGFLYMVFGKNMWNPWKLSQTTIAVIVGGFAAITVWTFYFNKPSSTALVSLDGGY